MKGYEKLEGETKEWIKSRISDDEVPHFVLEEGDRCPFLNEKGLCEMILQVGEDKLCDICSDHPRFRNFYSDFTEMGLGMCCEEAARVILNCEEPFELCLLNGDGNISPDDDEDFYIAYRQRIFDILSKRGKSVLKRFEEVSEEFGFKFSDFSLKTLCDTYINMERLDSTWGDELLKLKDYTFDMKIFEDKKFQLPFEQLACYFIFRHFTDALWDGKMAERVKFCLAGCFIIGAFLSMHDEKSIEIMEDYARRYSAEVEYSEENTEMLLDAIEE